jgi:hypothetical protein
MGNVLSRHAPASAYDRPHRSAFSSESGATDARPPAARRRPPRATPSVSERTAPGDQSRLFPREPRERPELSQSEIPSMAREPEGPEKPPNGLRLGDPSQRRFTRHGLRHFGLSSVPSPQPQPRGENRARPCLTTSATTAKTGHIPQTFENLAPNRTFHARRLPIWAASGETPVLAAGASKAPVHRPEDLESAYAAKANRPARIPPNTSCRVQASIGSLESNRSPTCTPRLASSPPRER